MQIIIDMADRIFHLVKV